MLANTQQKFKFGSWVPAWLLYRFRSGCMVTGIPGPLHACMLIMFLLNIISMYSQHTDLENSSGDDTNYYSAAEDLSNEPDV